MKSRLVSLAPVALLAVLLSGIGSAWSAPPSPLQGSWTGMLGKTRPQRVVFHLSQAAGGQWTGTVDFPDLSTTDHFPIDKLTFEQNRLHCEIKTFYATFHATLASDTPNIIGTWKSMLK
jgi:hypothetical protein